MQISSKQLVSGKLDWGWLQAIRTIIGTSLLTGCLILLFVLEPILRLANFTLLVGVCLGLIVAFGLSGYMAKEILASCRQNAPLAFSTQTATLLTLFWLTLLVVLAVKEPTEFGRGLLASWWAIAGTGLVGIAIWLAAWIAQAKPITEQDLAAAEHLSVVTYSDQTVVISPTPLSQQPRLFNGLILLTLSCFFWTMLTFPERVKEIATITLALAGLTSLTTWHLQFYSHSQVMRLYFSGILGLAATYTINIQTFSRLEIVKLTEGDLTWLQLSGQNTDLALPSAILHSSGKANENDELSQVLLDTCHLARHETSRDSLSLMGILLPQGTGILAGIIFLGAGISAMLFLPLPNQLALEGLLILMGCCFLSPKLARHILNLVAPTSLIPDALADTSQLQSWEVGAAVIITVVALQRYQGGATAPWLFFVGGWLSFGIGACILSLLRRTPIRSKN